MVTICDYLGKFVFRGHKVMLDSDLARLYEIETKALNRAVKRNIDRFPDFFMFQLTEDEFESLRCQIGTSNEGKGGRRYLPFVFTEHGVLMLYIEKNDKRVNEIIIALNNLIEQPPIAKTIGFRTNKKNN